MSNELITMDDTGLQGQLMSVTSSFSSLRADTPEEKKHLFNIMNNPEERVDNHINEVIFVKDVYCEMVDMMDEKTGEIVSAPRIILVNPEGVGYACVSKGIFSALKKLFNLYGVPTWEEPLQLKVKRVKTRTGNNSVLTLEMV